MSTGFEVHTLGCKANLSDSQDLEHRLMAAGLKPTGDGQMPGLFVINSCTVTDEADRQSRKLATRLKKLNPGAKIVFTGCAAEVNPEAIARTPGVDAVISNRDKGNFANLLQKVISPEDQGSGPDSSAPQAQLLGSAVGYRELLSQHPMDREWPAMESRLLRSEDSNLGASERTRAFLKVQDGCNAFCTYCVIPYGRGPTRSLPIATIVEQVQGLVARGFRELVITGINIGEYGIDWDGERKRQLVPLLRAIFEQTGIERLRVSSLDPEEIDSDLLELMIEFSPRFCPHFHVSLQSASKKILKLMKRKYSVEEVESTLKAISDLGSRLPQPVFIGMDLIVGFPGETEELFLETLERLRALPWSRLHVFPYSEREGTPATRLPGKVRPEVRKERAKILRQLSLERLQEQARTDLSQSQGIPDVLLEQAVQGPDQSGDWMSGYSLNYRRVLVRVPKLNQPQFENQIVQVVPESVWLDSVGSDVALIAKFQDAQLGVERT
jgi:threonylcarbamoyladenosine tRNA methylthiotransferase MtaB